MSLSALGIDANHLSTDVVRILYRCSTADGYVDDMNLQSLLNNLKSRMRKQATSFGAARMVF